MKRVKNLFRNVRLRPFSSRLLGKVRQFFDSPLEQGRVKNYLLCKYYMVPFEYLIRNLERTECDLANNTNLRQRERFREHLSYRLSTNIRGIHNFHKLMNFDEVEGLCSDFRNVRFLDLGCAWGGCCFPFARLGAQSFGIDIEKDRVDLALVNGRKFPNMDFECRDLSTDLSDDFGNKFNLMTCNQVLEHVKDVDTFIENVSNLLEVGGLVYAEIPNMLSLSCVNEEDHTKLIGMSLLDDASADGYALQKLSIENHSRERGSYLRFRQYEEVFRRHGLSIVQDNLVDSPQAVGSMMAEYETLKGNLESFQVSNEIESIVVKRISAYIRDFEHAAERLNAGKISRKEILTDYSLTSFNVLLKKN